MHLPRDNTLARSDYANRAVEQPTRAIKIYKKCVNKLTSSRRQLIRLFYPNWNDINNQIICQQEKVYIIYNLIAHTININNH